ncbi:hypothetical protein KAW55_07595 [bacterium]|nr:hypothetical protein [bacterium]
MNCQHKQLAQGQWQKLSLVAQLANIGSEVERALKWKNKNNSKYFMLAFERALELIDLTASDKKNIKRLKELMRVREMLVDYFLYDNVYHSTDRQWQNYFYYFNYSSRMK